jgi:XRE family transcriptional regulator, regulator of sulfur utilization
MPKPVPAKRPLPPPGDDVGAAELGRRIADRLKGLRRSRGLSLDQLAEASGVSRAALSQIETNRTNPTIGILWKVAVGIGVPFADLLGEDRPVASVLRRDETQVLRSGDGKFQSRSLSPGAADSLVEVYELRLMARARHASDAHAPGVREMVLVLSGALRMTVNKTAYEVAAGDSIWFAADLPHVYENPSTSEARYHNIIIYPR